MRAALAAWWRFHRSHDAAIREQCRNVIRYGVAEITYTVTTIRPIGR